VAVLKRLVKQVVLDQARLITVAYGQFVPEAFCQHDLHEHWKEEGEER
jgi:hypothetical protein